MHGLKVYRDTNNLWLATDSFSNLSLACRLVEHADNFVIGIFPDRSLRVENVFNPKKPCSHERRRPISDRVVWLNF
jgi:hypothetical protein